MHHPRFLSFTGAAPDSGPARPPDQRCGDAVGLSSAVHNGPCLRKRLGPRPGERLVRPPAEVLGVVPTPSSSELCQGDEETDDKEAWDQGQGRTCLSGALPMDPCGQGGHVPAPDYLLGVVQVSRGIGWLGGRERSRVHWPHEQSHPVQPGHALGDNGSHPSLPRSIPSRSSCVLSQAGRCDVERCRVQQ